MRRHGIITSTLLFSIITMLFSHCDLIIDDLPPGMTWITPVLLGGGSKPQIACNPAGNAITVWQHYDGSYYSIYANRYDSTSETWRGVVLLENNDEHASVPQIAMNESGDSITVWYQSDGSYSSIYAINYDAAAEAWHGAALLENNDEDAYAPQIAIDKSGNGIVVWWQNDGSYCSIYANYYDAAAEAWQGVVLLENNAGTAYDPQITMDGSGNAIAVWRQSDGSYSSIYTNYYDAVAEAWQGVVLLENNDGHAYMPQITMNESGNAIAVWKQSDGSYSSIYTNYYDAAAEAWQGASLLENLAGDAFPPQIAMDESGDACAVWNHNNGSSFSIYANYYDAAAKAWQGVVLLNNKPVDAFHPQIAMDESGNAIVVWDQDDSEEEGICFARYMFDTGWDQARYIYKSAVNELYDPQIVIDGKGKCTAVWYECTDTTDMVLACRGRLQ